MNCQPWQSRALNVIKMSNQAQRIVLKIAAASSELVGIASKKACGRGKRVGGRGVRKGAEKNNTKKVAEAIEANRNVKCELGDNSTVAPKREAYYKATDIYIYHAR